MSIVGNSGIFEDPSVLNRSNTWNGSQTINGSLELYGVVPQLNFVTPSGTPGYINTGNDSTALIFESGGTGVALIYRDGLSSASGYPLTNIIGTTTLAGPDGGDIYWAQPEQGTRKVFVAVFDAWENDSTTNQTITFPTAYSYTPAISTNTTGLTITATTTTLTITAPDVTTTYSGVVEVVGI